MQRDQSDLPVLRGERVLLRPVADADMGELTAILAQPSVAQWWGDVEPGQSRDELFGEGAAAFVIEMIDPAGEVAGSIQYHEETEPDYRHAGLDIFVRTDRQGQGLGVEAIRVLARHLFHDRGHHRLTIDPNALAIRAYLRAGFRPVGIMRRYERGRDGVWRDGLLMDLLSDELQ